VSSFPSLCVPPLALSCRPSTPSTVTTRALFAAALRYPLPRNRYLSFTPRSIVSLYVRLSLGPVGRRVLRVACLCLPRSDSLRPGRTDMRDRTRSLPVSRTMLLRCVHQSDPHTTAHPAPLARLLFSRRREGSAPLISAKLTPSPPCLASRALLCLTTEFGFCGTGTFCLGGCNRTC
jgi:hypothetical protein